MLSIRRLLMTATLIVFATSMAAQIEITHKPCDAFPIATNGHVATIFVSPNEPTAVKTAANLFANDIQRVTGIETAPAACSKEHGGNIIIAATIGGNKLVDKLIAQRRIDVSAIRGGWEQYVITVVERPRRGIDKALVVVGSNRRGVAYGLFAISEAMGVSPYYWWADVPVSHHDELWLSGSTVSKRPSVKYRGLFINDEDWGLLPWAANNFEKEVGNIGPRTYAKVCELILRLKGNMLAPAMHPVSAAFYSIPANPLVADSFGIVITTSHCEPLLINTASKWEWDTARDGDWNYKTNADAIRTKWSRRLDTARQFENIYTTAMRGLHDARLQGNLPLHERTQLLGSVIADQRTLLAEHLGKQPASIPQIFVPYKETMAVYEDGLEVPDDITLVWTDDNYGYMKRVNNSVERQRMGRAGVYYHISYWGAPHDYLWLCTTPPVLMYEELMKAYNAGADRYWLLNVGDIKPAELGMKTFFDLAYDVSSMGINNANNYQSHFLATIFGKEHEARIQHLLDEYYRLAWSRKPEYMGWDHEYDKPENKRLRDTEFSFQNYGEAQQRLADYNAIATDALALLGELPDNKRAAFFEMVAFPIWGSEQMNRKFLMAQLNHEEFAKGDNAKANWAARQAHLAYDSLEVLNAKYNNMLGGKWDGMMAFATGGHAKHMLMPELLTNDSVGMKLVDLSKRLEKLEGCYAVDLTKPARITETDSHKASVVKGLGYDWAVLQLGQPNDTVDSGAASAEYMLPAINADSATVTLYTVPFFPLYKGKATRIGVTIDGGKAQTADNKFKEYSTAWKDQVLRNAAIMRLKFAIDRSKPSHSITLTGIDPGMMIQKVIIDWGGLKKSYLGPSPRHGSSLSE